MNHRAVVAAARRLLCPRYLARAIGHCVCAGAGDPLPQGHQFHAVPAEQFHLALRVPGPGCRQFAGVPCARDLFGKTEEGFGLFAHHFEQLQIYLPRIIAGNLKTFLRRFHCLLRLGLAFAHGITRRV